MTSPIPNESFLQWDPAQVSSYVSSFLPESQASVLAAFIHHNVEGSLLPFITTDHLKELGIANLSIRLKIKRAITSLITDHYSKYPPTSVNDLEYKLNNININSNYVMLESLSLSTILMKDMFRKFAISFLSMENSPLSPSHQVDMKRLNDNFTKLKTDLIPVIRLLKDSKPLPTPTLDPGPAATISTVSPTFSVHSASQDTIPDTNNKADFSRSNSISSHTNRTSQIPSPTHSHRFSLGSLLSMGTGKVVLQSVSRPEAKPVSRNISRPKLVESKSAGATTTVSDLRDEDYDTLTSSMVHDNFKPALKLKGSLSSTHTISTNLEPQLSRNASLSHLQPQSQSHPLTEPLKQLRASSEDSCRKILTQAMKRHRIPEHDWSKYVLVICYGDKERILKLDEKPVIIFKELQELGRHPAIMLRMLASMDESEDSGNLNDSRIGDDIPGGTL